MPDPVTRLNAALSSRYRIERELGKGGMATVYLAEDLKHARQVALKVLEPDLAAVVGAERFLAEIRTTAKLQHPHILPLHDSGEADGFLFYVMPRVEGESLRERLDRERQLPVDEAVRLTAAVAQALDYAHRRGVIHRDIKPANILIHDGQPLISDFGIAIAVSAGGAGRLTETGLSLGTPHYMSPEQATGDASVGPAADVWALGCVLYEMLVGEPPYTGGTPQAVLGKIITAEPASATEARRSVPPNVDGVIRKSLEKVPADRFASASDLATALTDPDFRHEPAGAAGAGRRAQAGDRWKPLAIGLGATSVLLAAALALTATQLRRPEPRVVSRFEITPPGEQRLVVGETSPDIAISPDGRFIVYRGVAPGGGAQLWVRALDVLEAVPLPGTEGADGMAFSPDGLTVAYGVAGAIRTVPRTGGPPSTVVPAGSGPTYLLAFGPDGMIYFGRGDSMQRVGPGGGEAQVLTTPESGVLLQPDVLPGGGKLLVTRVGAYPGLNRIAWIDLGTGEVRELLTATMARYSSTGHLVYSAADGTLLAAPFDLDDMEITGPAVALAQGVRVHANGAAQFAVSTSGALLYGSGGSAGELVWVSRAGAATSVDPAWTQPLGHPALSPDGARVAVTIRDESSMNVWVKQLDRGPSLRLTLEGSLNGYPAWTPDGRSVTFFSDRAGPSFDLLTKRADGSTPAVLELDQERALAEAAWSPDGAWLVARTDRGEAGQGDLIGAPRVGGAAPAPLMESSFAELSPAISPDGRWLAYTSNETGREEIYVTPFPETGGAKWVVSTGGGTEPVWSRAGRELFYRSSGGDLIAVQVETQPTFSAGDRTVLFAAADYRSDVNHPQYDVSPDGQRFLMIRPVAGQGTLTLVLNFDELLRTSTTP